VRLFVAVDLPEEMCDAIGGTCERLRLALGRRVRARWVPTENIHVTIRFIGHVPDDRVPPLVAAVSTPLDIAPFELRLGRCGVFPGGGPPRIIWLGCAAGSSSLAAIHDAMNQRLAMLGLVEEGRPYSAHVTLARVADVARGSAASVRTIVQTADVVPAVGHIAHATLFRSLLSPRGARYEALTRVALTA